MTKQQRTLLYEFIGELEIQKQKLSKRTQVTNVNKIGSE